MAEEKKTTIRIRKGQWNRLWTIKIKNNCESLEDAFDILMNRQKKKEKSV